MDSQSVTAGSLFDHQKGMKHRICNQCRFKGPPRTLRLHHLLGCNFTISETSIQNKSVQSLPVEPSVPIKSVKFLEDKLLHCDKCVFKCQYYLQLKTHWKTHEEGNLIKCDKCQYTCEDGKVLHDHYQTHEVEKVFSCLICSRVFETQKKLKIHVKTHAGDDSFSCNICTLKFQTYETLKVHYYAHNKEKKHFTCDFCHYSSKQLRRFKDHILTHPFQNRSSYKQRNFVCSKPIQSNHQVAFNEMKPFSCGNCGLMFAKLVSLQKHTKLHTGEKPFGCDRCSFTCSKREKLKDHKLTHTPFICCTCNYKASRLAVFKKHIKMH